MPSKHRRFLSFQMVAKKEEHHRNFPFREPNPNIQSFEKIINGLSEDQTMVKAVKSQVPNYLSCVAIKW